MISITTCWKCFSLRLFLNDWIWVYYRNLRLLILISIILLKWSNVHVNAKIIWIRMQNVLRDVWQKMNWFFDWKVCDCVFRTRNIYDIILEKFCFSILIKETRALNYIVFLMLCRRTKLRRLFFVNNKILFHSVHSTEFEYFCRNFLSSLQLQRV